MLVNDKAENIKMHISKKFFFLNRKSQDIFCVVISVFLLIFWFFLEDLTPNGSKTFQVGSEAAIGGVLTSVCQNFCFKYIINKPFLDFAYVVFICKGKCKFQRQGT